MNKIVCCIIFVAFLTLITNNAFSQKILTVKCNWCSSSIKVKKSKDTYWSDKETTYYKYEYLNGFACGGGFQDYSKLVREFGYLFGIEDFIKDNSYCSKKCYYNSK
jgi:hypothetical protein